MNDDDLGNVLQELPRRHAPAGFTERVLARLDEGAMPTGTGRRWKAAIATAVLAVAWLGASAWREHVERRETAERVEMMREEYRALALELEELRALTRDAEPVLELGGTEEVEFVLDLRRHVEEGGTGRARPTSHSPR